MLARSPVSRLDAICRPKLVIHGANDVRVVQAESDAVTETPPACVIAGAVEAPDGKAVRDIEDPNPGTRRFELFALSPGQVERALAAADTLHASGVWADATPAERGEQLRPLASLLTERAADLARADSVDSGVLESRLAMILPSVAAGLGGLAEIAEAIGVQTRHDGYLGPVDQHRSRGVQH